MDNTRVLGSLTADQEARLQQLWMFLLNAFEISEDSDSTTFHRRSFSLNEPPLSPSSIHTTYSSGRRSISISSSHHNNHSQSVSHFSNPFAATVPNSPISPAFASSLSPPANSGFDIAKPQHHLSLKRLRRHTSLLSNGGHYNHSSPNGEKFPTEPSTPSTLRRASTTRKGSLSFHPQSMGGINLRPSPQNAKVIRRVLVSHKLTPDELRLGLLASLKHDHPDAMLLRFLRARKWDVGKAFVLVVEMVAWRTKKMHIDDDIMLRGELYALRQLRSAERREIRKGHDFMKQLYMGKNIIHGVDRMGRPIIDIRVRLHRAEDQSVEALERYIVHTIETVKLLLRPPFVETAILIFDMTDFSMANMDYTPVKIIIQFLENFYPECLAAIILHKAPWFFSGIWKVIKTWMNDSLVARVHFTKTVQDLERFIPRQNIPPDLGGTDDTYQYRYIEPDPTDRAENLSIDVHSPTRDFLAGQRQRIADEFFDATRLWLQSFAMRDAIGLTVQSNRRAELIEELRLNFWKLDPFVRARCQLDREGVIVGDGVGTIDFYPHLREFRRQMSTGEQSNINSDGVPEAITTHANDKASPYGGVGLGLLSPSPSTIDDDDNHHPVKNEETSSNRAAEVPKMKPDQMQNLVEDEDRSMQTDDHDHEHDHDHEESSNARDEIMQEYMDDKYDDYEHDHPHDLSHHRSQEYLDSYYHGYEPASSFSATHSAYTSGPNNDHDHDHEHEVKGEFSSNTDEESEEDEDEDEDEEIEIHDAVTHRIAYSRGGGFVERAAVRVVNVR